MHENEVTPEKLGADLKPLISDAEALLRATVGEPQELPECTGRDSNPIEAKKTFVRSCGYPTSPRSHKSFHPAPSEPVPPLPSQNRAGGQHWGSKKVTRRGSLREGSISDPASECARSPFVKAARRSRNQRLARRIADARNPARAV